MLAPARPPHDELEALIREARARQRRRRAGAAAIIGAVAALALVAWGVDRTFVGRGGSTARSRLIPAVDARAFAGHGKLAFVSRDRLWLLDGRTGRLIRLAGAGATRPGFSPNGRWLAWSQGTKRFGLSRSNGTGARLLPSRGASASWLPDGRLLVGRAIYRIDHGVPVRSGIAPAGLVSWAPDGRYAFVVSRRNWRRLVPYKDVERVELATSLHGRRTAWYETPESFTTRSGWQDPAIGHVAILPKGGILVWLDPFHSGSIAADGLPVYQIAVPGARPRKLGVSIGTPLSVGKLGRFALGAGGDRIAWTTKRVVTCAADGCRPLHAPKAQITLDPAWSPGGGSLAYVTAADLGVEVSTVGTTMQRWYRTRRLRIGRRTVPDSTGAASPVWSADGRSLLFVSRDGLWLLPRVGAQPIRVATPLFWPGRWPNFYGRVDWTDQFAWSSGQRPGHASAAASLPRCRTNQLRLTAPSTWRVAAGSLLEPFTLTNVSSAACRVAGWPAVRLIDAAGRTIPTRSFRYTYSEAAKAPFHAVMVRPGRAASFNYFAADWNHVADRACPNAREVQIRLPGSRHWNSVALKLPACGRLFIDPFVPGHTDARWGAVGVRQFRRP
jgi:hypothetical protein